MNYKDDLYKSRSEMDHAPKRRITQKAKFEVRFFSAMTTQEMEDYLKPLFKKVTRLHLSVYIKKSIR